MKLSDMPAGAEVVVVKVAGQGSFRKRILELGFVRGRRVRVVRNAPLMDPVEYEVMGARLALHRHDAQLIEVQPVEAADDVAPEADAVGADRTDFSVAADEHDGEPAKAHPSVFREIKIALVGNPNSGKTSIFNALSGANEHVGNYSGVTVAAHERRMEHDGYTFILADLPGTYSLAAYTPEERYVNRYLMEEHPDIVLNVIDASNLERNLYLTAQLIDMNLRVVGALNMYDELERRGDRLDSVQLSRLLGIPMVPTVGKDGRGLEHLLHWAVMLYERNDFPTPTPGEAGTWSEHFCTSCALCKGRAGMASRDCCALPQIYHHVHVNHGNELERAIRTLQDEIKRREEVRGAYSTRWLAIKLLENNSEVEAEVLSHPGGRHIIQLRDRIAAYILARNGADCETMVTDAKYAFVSGALKEVYQPADDGRTGLTSRIDDLVTHRLWGYPIFLLFMFLMFQCTFTLGALPQAWIEDGVAWLGDVCLRTLPASMWTDMLVDGVLGGVGSVLSFVPNILILYLFISFMEDSGYMARAAFLMDKFMHRFGLHGRSFIPMLMGFGCSVPAVMATRTIEDRRARTITALITPFMSCSARLPVYLLLIGTFFPRSAGLVLFALYLFGILCAALVAKFLSSVVFKKADIPFVIELPPYRLPSLRLIAMHTWSRVVGYLHKLGGIILFASLAIWALGYFPHSPAPEEASVATATAVTAKAEPAAPTYIEQIGHAIEPVMRPLGFNWQLSVGLVAGLGAKELVVSTLGVLYGIDTEAEAASAPSSLAERIPIAPHVALAYMVFVLLYVPCLAAVSTIARETRLRFALVQAVGSTALAWLAAFVVYQLGCLLV